VRREGLSPKEKSDQSLAPQKTSKIVFLHRHAVVVARKPEQKEINTQDNCEDMRVVG